MAVPSASRDAYCSWHEEERLNWFFTKTSSRTRPFLSCFTVKSHLSSTNSIDHPLTFWSQNLERLVPQFVYCVCLFLLIPLMILLFSWLYFLVLFVQENVIYWWIRAWSFAVHASWVLTVHRLWNLFFFLAIQVELTFNFRLFYLYLCLLSLLILASLNQHETKGLEGTAVLDVLSDRLNKREGKVKGDLILNGVYLSPKKLSQLVSYVHQDLQFCPQMTATQTLLFTSLLQKAAKRPNSSPNTNFDTKNRTYALLEELGLSEVRSSCVSTLNESEKRRLMIAVALLVDTDILLLDQPVKGMDIFDTFFLTEYLRQWALISGRCVIMTIQPATFEIFSMLSRVALLSTGRILFTGKAKALLSYFSYIDYPCPSFKNPSDYYLDLVTLDNLSSEAMLESSQRIENLADTFARRHSNAGVSLPGPPSVTPPTPKKSGFIFQTFTLLMWVNDLPLLFHYNCQTDNEMTKDKVDQLTRESGQVNSKIAMNSQFLYDILWVNCHSWQLSLNPWLSYILDFLCQRPFHSRVCLYPGDLLSPLMLSIVWREKRSSSKICLLYHFFSSREAFFCMTGHSVFLITLQFWGKVCNSERTPPDNRVQSGSNCQRRTFEKDIYTEGVIERVIHTLIEFISFLDAKCYCHRKENEEIQWSNTMNTPMMMWKEFRLISSTLSENLSRNAILSETFSQVTLQSKCNGTSLLPFNHSRSLVLTFPYNVIDLFGSIFVSLLTSILIGVIYWHVRVGREQEHLWDRIAFYHSLLAMAPLPIFLMFISDGKAIISCSAASWTLLIITFMNSTHREAVCVERNWPRILLQSLSLCCQVSLVLLDIVSLFRCLCIACMFDGRTWLVTQRPVPVSRIDHRLSSFD